MRLTAACRFLRLNGSSRCASCGLKYALAASGVLRFRCASRHPITLDTPHLALNSSASASSASIVVQSIVLPVSLLFLPATNKKLHLQVEGVILIGSKVAQHRPRCASVSYEPERLNVRAARGRTCATLFIRYRMKNTSKLASFINFKSQIPRGLPRGSLLGIRQTLLPIKITPADRLT